MSDSSFSPAGFARVRSRCRSCLSSELQRRVHLRPLPVSSPNVGQPRGSGEFAPADLYQCGACGLLQLATVIDPEYQYRQFKYTTGISAGLRAHFDTLIGALVERGEIRPNHLVLDIGSNDGSLLRLAQQRGARIVGVDPAVDIAAEARKSGVPTIDDFFNPATAHRIVAEFGATSTVISANTVANIDDLDEFFSAVDALLAPDGLMVIETQYALDVVEKFLLDVIYHEHVSYFAVRPFQSLLQRRGFELIDAEKIAPKGGSIRFYIQKVGGPRPVSSRVATLAAAETAAGLYDEARYERFTSRIMELGARTRERLSKARRATGQAFAYGSSVGCAALIHYLELGPHIDAIFDDRPLAQSIRTQDRNIPVLSGEQLDGKPASDVAVLAWRYADLIAAGHERFRRSGGRFYRVLPNAADVG